MATVLEHCQISPPSTAPELSVPVVFFDILWYTFSPNQSVLFFNFPCSTTHFLEIIVPQLKHSLSLTLSHFLPLAGKLVHPLKPGNKPILRYVAGDSVSFTVSESTNADISHFSSNQPRACDEFYAFAPQLPPAKYSDDAVECSVLALQATLFPGHGVALGFVAHHAVADASTVVSFLKSWALINRLTPANVESCLLENNLLPSYDRTSVVDLNVFGSSEELPESLLPVAAPPPIPAGKTRATFVLKRDEIEKLKGIVAARRGGGVKHLSSFTVACALAWICSTKSAATGGVEVADDEAEHFCFVADCRGRLSPPVPANYFGNCLALLKTDLRHGVVKGEEGFVTAAESIGGVISEAVEKGMLHAAAGWEEEYTSLAGKRTYGVAGSPRFDFYEADFGWGRAEKFEPLFIDENGSVSLCKSREFEGGLEIGLAKPKAEMEAFAAIFTKVLADLINFVYCK